MKKILSLILTVVVCTSFVACDAKNLEKADEYFANQEYALALELYESLPENDEIKIKIDECKKEIGMTENADYAFLADIEKSILDRNEKASASSDPDRMLLVNTELVILEKYKDQEFYDSTLENLCDKYLEGLYLQKEALGESIYSDYQMKWQKGIVKRYDALNELYLNYDFLTDDTSFISSYVSDYDYQKNLLKAYEEIEADILSQFSPEGYEWKMPNSYTFECIVKNNTTYEYSTVWEIYFYDKNNVMYESSTAYIEKIKPNTSYKVSFYISDPYSLNSFEWNNWYSNVVV